MPAQLADSARRLHEINTFGMEQRIDYKRIAPDAYAAMAGIERYVRKTGLERPLLELVKIRASQINGCAFCIDMHTQDARTAGETEQRLYLLAAWREAPFYTPRERAALDYAEALTLVASGGVPDALMARTREHFTDEEIIALTMAVVAINGWNRMMIAFAVPAGTYRPAATHASA